MLRKLHLIIEHYESKLETHHGKKYPHYPLLKDSGEIKLRQSLALRVVVILADLVPVNDIPECF